MVVVADLADLDVVHLVILQPAELLSLDMLRMHAPGALALLVLELHDGDPLAIIGPEAFMRDVARNGPGDLLHSIDQGNVFVLKTGPQPRPKYGNDHGNLLRGEPPFCRLVACRSNANWRWHASTRSMEFSALILRSAPAARVSKDAGGHMVRDARLWRALTMRPVESSARGTIPASRSSECRPCCRPRAAPSETSSASS